MKKKNVLLITIVTFVTASLGIYFGYNYNLDHNTKVFLGQGKGESTPYHFAEMVSKGMPNSIVRFISECKIFPESFKDYEERTYNFLSVLREGQPSPRDGVKKCERTPFVVIENELADPKKPELSFPWIDPWGRPYQIRYDLERAKLQVRSRGRYLWWPWDDVIGETYFDGKSYKAQVEYCKTVPKDDMSCIFNRGWH